MSYDFDYYSGSHLKVPVKLTKPTLGRNPTAIDARAFADALEEYEREYKAYKENMTFYELSRSSLIEEFKLKLINDYELSQIGFDVIWGNANDYSGFGGLKDIFNEFERLSDLIEKYNNVVKGN